MTDKDGSESGVEHCSLCSGDYPADIVETITSAAAAIGYEMTPKAFRTWLMTEAREPDL